MFPAPSREVQTGAKRAAEGANKNVAGSINLKRKGVNRNDRNRRVGDGILDTLAWTKPCALDVHKGKKKGGRLVAVVVNEWDFEMNSML